MFRNLVLCLCCLFLAACAGREQSSAPPPADFVSTTLGHAAEQAHGELAMIARLRGQGLQPLLLPSSHSPPPANHILFAPQITQVLAAPGRLHLLFLLRTVFRMPGSLLTCQALLKCHLLREVFLIIPPKYHVGLPHSTRAHIKIQSQIF